MNETSFPERIQHFIKKNSGLCVGFDPSQQLLASWKLTDDVEGLYQYTRKVMDACIKVGISFVKIQIAFYERFGWQGAKILSEMSYELRKAGIIVILDGKRGDIGSTASAYAEAYLSDHDLYKYDAMTVNPFLGFSSLEPYLSMVRTQRVGIFIILRSSNSDSSLFQEASTQNGDTVANCLASYIDEQNRTIFGEKKLGAIGAVIGSTVLHTKEILSKMPTTFFLCPGIGAQGATIESSIEHFGVSAARCIFPISRGLTLNIQSELHLIEKISMTKMQFQTSIKKYLINLD